MVLLMRGDGFVVDEGLGVKIIEGSMSLAS